MEPGLGSSTWWEEPAYKQLATVNLRALFVLDKLIEKDIQNFRAAWTVAFPGRPCTSPFSPSRLPGAHGS